MSCAEQRMDIKTLYQDEEVTLQRLVIRIGHCRMVKYRVVRNSEDELDVQEIKDIPNWYLRFKKLQQLGI